MRSERNTTGMVDTSIERLAQALAFSEGPIFNGPGSPYDLAAPQLSSCVVQRENGSLSSLDHPQRGVIVLQCTWASTDELHGADIRPQNPEQEEAFKGLRIDGNTVSVSVITEKLLRNGTKETTCPLIVSAKNARRFTTSETQTLSVQTQAPKLIDSDLSARWVGPTGATRVQGKTDLPIRRIYLSDGEKPLDSVSYPYEAQQRHFDVAYEAKAPCNRKYLLHLVLEDWAGNTTAYDYPIMCDRSAPNIVSIRSPFRQDDTNRLEDLDDWDSAKTFAKDYTRLDFIPEEGLNADVQNLPTLAFKVSDTDGALSIGAQDDELRVEYSYAMGKDPDHRRGWLVMQPDSDNVYRLPISYQTLLSPNYQGPATNFVARCKSTDEHRIIIRATDPAGNTTEKTFTFFLNLFAPAVSLTDCRPTGALEGADLVNSNFHFVFTRGFPLYDAHIRYNQNLSNRSLAPSFSVVVRPSVRSIHSEVTHLKYTGAPVAAQTKDGLLLVESSKPNANTRIEAAYRAARDGKNPKGFSSRIGRENGQVAGSKYAVTRVHRDIEEASIGSDQDVSYVLLTPNGYLQGSDADGPLEVTPNTTYVLRTLMNGEFKFEDGTTLPWNNHVPDVDGTIAVELLHEYGVQMDAGPMRVVELRKSVAGLSMTRPPMGLELQSPQDGVPLPISIEMDQSCREHMPMHWRSKWY
jgi:hypothetical protein